MNFLATILIFKITLPFFFTPISLLADTHSPHSDDGIKLAPSIRTIIQNSTSTYVGEYAYTQLNSDQAINDISLVYRYRFAPHSKIGIRMSLKTGLLHDNDWVKIGDNWQWRNTEDRYELIPSVEYQYRLILDFIPGENWVGEFRSNVDYNSHLGEVFFRPRVGISFFGFSKGRPLYNFFARLIPYIKISNDFGNLYEFGTYAGFAYHFSPSIQASISHQFVQQKWQFSNNIDAFKNNHIIGLNLNFLVSMD